MRKHHLVNFGERVVVRSDRDFTVWLIAGDETFLAGPQNAGARITSFTVPRGVTEVIVDCDADAVTTIDVAQNRFTEADARTLVRELEEDRPESVRDLIANTIAETMRRQKLLDSEPESVEEANDFDVDFEAWGDETFARLHLYKEVQEELLKANSDATDAAAVKKEPEAPATSHEDEKTTAGPASETAQENAKVANS